MINNLKKKLDLINLKSHTIFHGFWLFVMVQLVKTNSPFLKQAKMPFKTSVFF